MYVWVEHIFESASFFPRVLFHPIREVGDTRVTKARKLSRRQMCYLYLILQEAFLLKQSEGSVSIWRIK